MSDLPLADASRRLRRGQPPPSADSALDAFYAKTKAERTRRNGAQRSRYQQLRAQGACGICGTKSRRAYCPACAHKVTSRARTKRLGLTEAGYAELLLEQGAKCAICHAHQAKLRKALHADHNHVTGDVRGLLCHRCNMALGLFRDDPRLLRIAAAYLASRGASGLSGATAKPGRVRRGAGQ